MNINRIVNYLSDKSFGIRFLFLWAILSFGLMSCQPDQHGLDQFNESIITIGDYLTNNQEQYSKFIRLLDEGDLLITLGAYNPYSDGYTLFLPTDGAMEQFVQQNEDYGSFEEMLQDTSYIKNLARYHTMNKIIHSKDFPHGALLYNTLSGDRLTIGVYADGDSALYKVNNRSSIIKSNLEMTNGYIHIISGVLEREESTGYDWLQQQEGYSILAKAMEIAGVKKNLWVDKYTIFAEHDSIYHRNGIMTVEDLISRVATPGLSYSNRANAFYKFAGFHILGGEYYLNEFYFGNHKYQTLGLTQLTIQVGLDIKINPGVDTYGITISERGDTTIIDYVSPMWENSNMMTRSGPVHSISEVLFFQPLP